MEGLFIFWVVFAVVVINISQETITQSIQLLCVRATAFSEVGLFSDLQVFSVKISVSDYVHIQHTTFQK